MNCPGLVIDCEVVPVDGHPRDRSLLAWVQWQCLGEEILVSCLEVATRTDAVCLGPSHPLGLILFGSTKTSQTELASFRDEVTKLIRILCAEVRVMALVEEVFSAQNQ